MATYGAASAPSQNTINYDSILGTSLFNYRKTLTDNISKSNPFFYKIQENGMYESEDGGVAIQIPHMYGLAKADTYSGYDVLNVDPTDGITNAFFDWRQMAVPISISRFEERQNAQAHRIIDLIKSKIYQAEIGLKQFFAQQLMQGAALSSGNIYDPYTSPANASFGIEPISKLVAKDPTSSTVLATVGNINQSSATWWRNQTKSSALTSSSHATDFILEADTIYNNCAKGPGGPPDFILVDQNTYQMWRAAYYNVYRRMADSDNNYPFENFRFNRALVMWDEYTPDVQNNNTAFPATNGTAFFFNSKFLQVKYDTETNFVNTPFQKPVNQDAKVAHIIWMGNVCINNRRKHGVWYNIPTSLTYAT